MKHTWETEEACKHDLQQAWHADEEEDLVPFAEHGRHAEEEQNQMVSMCTCCTC